MSAEETLEKNGFDFAGLKAEWPDRADALLKAMDEFAKGFYYWVIFDNDSLPTNSTDLDNLISEYKKTLEQ